MPANEDPSRATLLGEHRARSLAVVTAACALAPAGYLLRPLVERRTVPSEVDLLLVVFALIVCGGAVAATVAYWNDGLLPTWLLVFGPTLGWLWHGRPAVAGPLLVEVLLPSGWAGVVALPAGTLGYVVGRRWRGSGYRATSDRRSEVERAFLLPRGPRRARRWALVAVSLFAATAVVTYGVRPEPLIPLVWVAAFDVLDPALPLTGNVLLGTTVALGFLAAAVAPAYRDDGLLLSWALVFAPAAGAAVTQLALFDAVSGWLEPVTLGLFAALLATLVFGTGGFLLGTLLRRVAARPRSDYRSRERAP